MAAERDAFPIPRRHPPRKRGKLCQHTSSKRRQRFSVCKQSGYFVDAFIRIPVRVSEYSSAIPLKTTPINLPRLSRKLTPSNFAPSNFGIAAISATPRRARRPLRALRVARPVERSQRRFARVVARLEPVGPTRTTPAPSRAPRIPQLAPRRSKPPPPPTDVRACRERGGARRRRRRRVSHGAVRTMDGTHRRRHHHRSVSVFRRPGRARTGARAPLYSVVWQEKISLFHVLNTFSRESDTLGPKLPRIQLAAFAPG